MQSLLDRQDAITQREFAKAQEASTLEVMRADAKLRKEITELIADLETYRKYAEQGEHVKPQSEENGDTREQLERCLRVFLGLCIDEEPDPTNSGIYYNILGLLDRQVAITSAEWCWSNDALEEELMRKESEIAELTAERDNLQAAIDAMNNGQFYAMYKAKCEECEQLKKVVRTQAESFKKLECELAGKDG